MEEKQMYLIDKLFNNDTIRKVWNKDEEEYYICIIDIVKTLTRTNRPRKYWSDLKGKLKEEGSELSEKIGRLKHVER